jgi:D-tyrosyl-tRNA(Tyr) deacylase
LRALVQRVSEGSVFIANEDYSANIEKGMVLLLGIKTGDTIDDVNYLADKCCNLRIFEDDDDKMNLSINDISGEILVISQFTLYGDTKRGNRAGFTDAAKPDEAIPLYEKFIRRLKENIGENKVKTGLFGAMMQVKIINEGPVTLMIESK